LAKGSSILPFPIYYGVSKMRDWKLNLLVILLVMSAFLDIGCKSRATLAPETTAVSNIAVTDTPAVSVTFEATVVDETNVLTVSPIPATVTAVPSIVPASVAPTLTPSPEATLAQGRPAIFYFDFKHPQGFLARTDLSASLEEQIVTVAPLGENGEAIGRDVAAYFAFLPPRISPDGQWIIVNNGSLGGRLVNVASGAFESGGVGQGADRLDFTWAPNSQRFAYITSSELCIYELAEQTTTCPLTSEQMGFVEAEWSPAGSYIAVAEAMLDSACCSSRVWLLDAAAGTREVVAEYDTLPHTEDILTWSADGQLLLVESADSPSILFSPGDGVTTAIELFVRDMSPDGRYLLHLFDGNGRAAGISQADGTLLYDLPAACVGSRPIRSQEGQNWAWSPDGTRLAYVMLCPKAGSTVRFDRHLYVIAVNGGEILLEEAFSDFAFSVIKWSSDGNYLLLDIDDVISASSPTLSPIWRLAADSGGSLEMVVEQGFLLDVVRQWDE
jgi:WD40 repeat protein